MYNDNTNYRQEFMFNTFVQIIVGVFIAFALGWPMQVVVNWFSQAIEFGETISYFGGVAFSAMGIALYHFLPKLPIPFQFNKKE